MRGGRQSPVKHLPLVRVPRDETVHFDWPVLPDPVAPSLSLKQRGRGGGNKYSSLKIFLSLFIMHVYNFTYLNEGGGGGA